MAKNASVPVTLSHYVGYEQGLQALSDGKIGWLSPDLFKGPFSINSASGLEFDEAGMVEQVIQDITHMVFARDAPNSNCDHPVFKAVRRWRNEDRFQNEEEVATALKDIVPSLVQPQFAFAQHAIKEWAGFVRKTRLLLLSETIDDLGCWERKADNHRGVILRFKVLDEGMVTNPHALEYGNQWLPVTSLREQIKILFGEIKIEDVATAQDRLLRGPKAARSEKEWRCFYSLDADSEKPAQEEPILMRDFAEEDLAGVYLGVGLSREEKRKIISQVKKNYKKAKVFEGRVRQFEYALEFDKIEL